MPIYEFSCAACGERFEDLVRPGTERLECPRCGARETRRLMSRPAELLGLVMTPLQARRMEQQRRAAGDASKRRRAEAPARRSELRTGVAPPARKGGRRAG